MYGETVSYLLDDAVRVVEERKRDHGSSCDGQTKQIHWSMKVLLEKHEQECLNKTIHDATDEHHHEEEEDLKVGEN